MIDFLKMLGDENFGKDKDKVIFLINNVSQMVNNLNQLNLDKELDDKIALEKNYSQEIDKLITIFMLENFEGILDIVKTYSPGGNSDSDSSEGEGSLEDVGPSIA
jgi:hypothetical protein